MNFKEEIKSRVEKQDVPQLRSEVWNKWGEFLFGSNIEKKEELSHSQIAFLSMLTERYDEKILPLINVNVKEEFDNWYEDCGLYEEIRMQSLDISEIGSGSWQIMFEDDNVDPIVHLYMKNWSYDYTAVTG